MEQTHLCNLFRGHYQQHICEIILDFHRLFRRGYRLNIFLSTALVAVLFGGVNPAV